MGDWSTYSLSDFLMFSPQAYWRLVQRYNQAWWPAQLAFIAAGLTLLPLARGVGAPRAGYVLLALAWAVVGWAFHWQRYSEVFLAAAGFALGCGLQALLLLVAARALRAGATPPPRALQHAGQLLVALAVLAVPLLPVVSGRGWSEAEVFGLMPEPTALATLGFLVAARGPAWLRGGLAVLPALSLAIGLATRWTMAQ